MRGLEALCQSGDSFVALLIPIILKKLPGEVRKNLARENRTDNWQLNDLRRSILKEINIMEAGKCTESLESYQPTASFLTNTRNETRKTEKVSRNNLDTGNHGNKTKIKQKPCVYCYGLPDLAKCSNVVEYNHRLSIVKHKKLCFNCLGSHRSAECRSQFRCRHCLRSITVAFVLIIHVCPTTHIPRVKTQRPNFFLSTQ